MTSNLSLRDMLKNDQGVRERKKRRKMSTPFSLPLVFLILLFVSFLFPSSAHACVLFWSDAGVSLTLVKEGESEKNKWIYVHYGHNPRSHAAHRDVMLTTISTRHQCLVFLSRNTFRFPVNTMDNNMNISNYYNPSLSAFSSDSSMSLCPHQVGEHQIDEQINLEALKTDSNPLSFIKKREKKTVSFPFGQWWVTDELSVLSSMDPGNHTWLTFSL